MGWRSQKVIELDNDNPEERGSDQENGEAGGSTFGEGPLFDPERGVVYPATVEPEAGARPADRRGAPQSAPPLELDGQAAAHAFATSRSSPEGDAVDPASQPFDEGAPRAPGGARASRGGKAAVALIAILVASLGGAAYLKSRHSGSERTPVPSSPATNGPIGASLAAIKAQGRELQEKAKAGFEATRRGIEDLTSAPLLIIESTPSGAEIWIDGEWLGNTPFAGDNRHARGAHEIRLRLDGHRDATLEIQGGESSRLNVTLRPR